MGLYAIIKGDIVDGIAISDSPLDTDGIWIDITDVSPTPGRDWTYVDGVFSAPVASDPVEPPPPPKTEEQKIADATAAAIAKLIADGVLKQA